MNGFIHKRPKSILVVAAAVLMISLAGGSGVVSHLSDSGFDANGTESARTSERMQSEFNVGESDAVLLITARNGDIDSPASVAAGNGIVAELRTDPAVVSVLPYWANKQLRSLRGEDGSQALVVVELTGSQHDKSAWLSGMHERYDQIQGEVTVQLGGKAEVFRAIQGQVIVDLIVAEAIAVSLSMILLLFVFRSVTAALLPIALGALSGGVTLFVLRVLSSYTEVSVFALNLTSALALGLGIDYGLLMVTRFREELAAGRATPEAIARTMRTAGRTVMFSGIAVALSLATLLLFPLPVLRSFGYAAIPVVVVAVLGATVVLPAMLRLLGPGINRGSLHRLPRINASEQTWERLSTWTIRHRIPVSVIGVLMLCALAVPFFHIDIGRSDDRVLPADTPVRQVQQQIRTNFPANLAFPISVYLPGLGRSAEDQKTLDEFSARISNLPEIGLVQGGQGIWQHGQLVQPIPGLATQMSTEQNSYLSVLVRPDIRVYSSEATRAVEQIQDIGREQRVMVGGESARFVDNRQVIGDRLPVAIGLIMLCTFGLVFLLTGSVVVPIKALFLNLLSLTATFGVMVWIFQDGHLAGLFGFTPSGYLDNAVPVLMFCTAFGLSMDYELFLVARIHEEFLKTGDNDLAIIEGIKKTGAVFTSAALLLSIVFAGLIASEVSLVQMAGLGIVLAIIMDATLIRSLMVPALMSMMGRANWWAPGFLRRLHTRLHLSESPAPTVRRADSRPTDSPRRVAAVDEVVAAGDERGPL